MLRRQLGACALVSSMTQTGMRSMSIPGWKQKVSTRDGRSREKRDQDRKQRQIDKLPKVQALHDYQYPHEKTVMGDAMGQHPVFENELDTPHLFFATPPNDFFLYFNVSDFERSAFPAVPMVDHRLLSAEGPAFQEELLGMGHGFLEKHEISPALIPHVDVTNAVNMSVVWDDVNAKKVDGAKHQLTRQNFWRTAHYGNFIPLQDLQNAPELYLTVPKAKEESLYTLMIVSPDYPYRTKHTDGFMLQYVVTNIKGKHLAAADEPKFEDLTKATKLGVGAAEIAKKLSGKENAEFSTTLKAMGGDVVVPYVPPLPTEEAGTTRHLCLVFEQTAKVNKVAAPRNTQEEEKMLPFVERCNFRLHSLPHEERAKRFQSLADVEAVVAADPCAVTFFQTAWDIQVQEFYEDMSLDEPRYVFDEDDELNAQIHFNSIEPEKLRIRSRKLPDGSTDADGNSRLQVNNTMLHHGTANAYFSSRTHLGSNKKKVVTPK